MASATVLYGQSESATRWSLASLGLGFAIFAIQSAILDSNNDDFEEIYQRARYSIQYIYSDSTRSVNHCVKVTVMLSIWTVISRKLLHGILAEKTPVITTQSKKELEEEMLLVKEAMEFEEVLENPEESPEDEVAEDGEGEEEE